MSFTLSNVFSGAFSSVSKGFVPLLIATLVLYIVPNQLIVEGLRFGMGLTLGTAQSFQGPMATLSMGAVLVTYILTFMHMSAVYEICVLTTAGKPVKLGQVILHSLGNVIPILVIYILCSIGWMIGLTFLIVPGLIFGTLFSVVVPAYVTERAGIFNAFSRSRALTKGHRWGVFGLWLLVGVILYVVAIAIEMPIVMPMIQSAIKAAQMGRPAPTTATLPSLPVMLAIAVAISLIWVVVLAINASVYSCLRAGKERLTGATVEKVFE